ncbi:hypothetical protein MetMK1DRAFT_00027810 [Metallosphaera yellowstonensis MK1]|uniref:DUF5658 domain-containing protein n=1 Tax=Metallosphaera yellowstonensis MK1 TaxID=671065 RepID=H2C875_9CREN|nr:DUF5658 family protein [Metallosphaera yellowstonensis]EHP68351.1 hypothetical protein MetMK1DRAFT_00027810 [Metallosphaera yellowstonensis MK1]
MMLAEIVAFYGFQFTDFLTTWLGLRAGAAEVNAVMRPFVTSVPRFVIFKFGLATFLLIFVFLTAQDWLTVLHLSPMSVVYIDTIVEGAVTCSNIYTLWRVKK